MLCLLGANIEVFQNDQRQGGVTELVVKEPNVSKQMNDMALQHQHKVKQSEISLHKASKEERRMKQEIRKVQDKLEHAQNAKTSLEELVQVLEDSLCREARQNRQSEQKLSQQTRKCLELEENYSKLESDITQREKEYKLLEKQKLDLETKVAVETGLKEEHEGRAVSLEVENSRLLAEVNIFILIF